MLQLLVRTPCVTFGRSGNQTSKASVHKKSLKKASTRDKDGNDSIQGNKNISLLPLHVYRFCGTMF